MIKKTITYTDYNGTKRTEDFLFNLNKSELTEMELSTSGGLSAMLQTIVHANDTPAIVKVFKDILFKAYGQKSADGRQFIKSNELSIEFSQTEAYDQLFMELLSDEKKAADFFNGLMPADLVAQVEAEKAKEGFALVDSEATPS